jgi:transposase
VLLTAFAVGQASLRAYSHVCSPKKFTQPQLFACLVLKEFMQLDYRKLATLLHDAPSLAAAIELKTVPHFTTFQKAARRLLKSRHAERLLDQSVEQAIERKVVKRKVKLAALDGTGFETRHISAYYVKRRERACKTGYQTTTYTRYPVAEIICDCASHMALGVVTGRGPGPEDKYFRPVLDQARGRTNVNTVLADAGLDSESAHCYARQTCGMRTLIPPTRGRPTEKLPSGRWRRVMATRFNKQKYGQRWQVETLISMIKRMLGSALRARKYWTQNREIVLRVLTHNIMILRMRFSTEQDKSL